MRHLTRPALQTEQADYLRGETTRVVEATDANDESKIRWRRKSTVQFTAIRAALESIVGASKRCMYCDDSAATDIDHFEPRARNPARTFDWPNYALACSHCNSNQKRDQFPVDGGGSPLLLNPLDEDPSGHLVLNPATGRLSSESVKGVNSITVFGLNRERLTVGRIDGWTSVQSLVRYYADMVASGRRGMAQQVLHTLHDFAFAEVLDTMRAYSRAANDLLDPAVRDIFDRHPEL